MRMRSTAKMRAIAPRVAVIRSETLAYTRYLFYLCTAKALQCAFPVSFCSSLYPLCPSSSSGWVVASCSPYLTGLPSSLSIISQWLSGCKSDRCQESRWYQKEVMRDNQVRWWRGLTHLLGSAHMSVALSALGSAESAWFPLLLLVGLSLRTDRGKPTVISHTDSYLCRRTI